MNGYDTHLNDHFVNEHAEWEALFLALPWNEESPEYADAWERLMHTYCLCVDCWFPS